MAAVNVDKRPRSSGTRKNKNKPDTAAYNVATKNSFELLNKIDNRDTTAANIKTKLPTPIVLTQPDIKINEVLAALGTNYRVKRVSIGIKIFTDTNEDRMKVAKVLKDANADFYSHPTHEEKTFKAVLTGLPLIETNVITDCLREEHNMEARKIVNLAQHRHSGLYLVHFAKSDVCMATLKGIKHVYNHIIGWKPYKPRRRGPTQCYNCGMFGHGATYCSRKTVCLLCSGAHATSDCAPVDAHQQTLKCVNCSAKKLNSSHKASDEKCPLRAEYIEMRARINKSKNPRVSQSRNMPRTHTTHTPTHTQPAPTPPPLTTSYSDALRKNNNNRTRMPSSHECQSGSANAESNVNNGLWTIAQVSDLLLNALNDLSKCRNKFDQMRVITNLLQNAVN